MQDCFFLRNISIFLNTLFDFLAALRRARREYKMLTIRRTCAPPVPDSFVGETNTPWPNRVRHYTVYNAWYDI